MRLGKAMVMESLQVYRERRWLRQEQAGFERYDKINEIIKIQSVTLNAS